MIIKLNRTILALKGNQNEILQLLQGISSNDLKKISNNEVIYNLFLSSDGKFLFDNFIFLMDEIIHLDFHPDFADKIISHIKKYKMRLNIEFVTTNINCYANLNSKEITLDKEYKDLRNEIIGTRIYVEDTLQNAKEDIEYHRYRIENNIPEASYDMQSGASFPIHFMMYELNAISLSKGCYIGQEQTNRLHRTGVIRKKLQSFLKKDFEFTSNLFGATVSKNEKIIGKLCSIYNDEFGFILSDIE